MPSWKKVITSGSNAALNHITSSGNISGSFQSTGSFGQLLIPQNGNATAITALNGNFNLSNIQLEHAANGGQIKFGSNTAGFFHSSGRVYVRKDAGFTDYAFKAVDQPGAAGFWVDTVGRMKFGHGYSNQAIFDMMTLGQQPGHASGSLLVSGSIIAKEGNISGSSTSTGSFGKLAVGTATIQIPSNGFITMGSLDGMVMNTRFGNNAGQNLQAGGTQNVIVGEDAGAALTTGDTNVAVGSEALKTATGDSNNVAIGRRALHDLNTTNARNVAVGTGAGDGMTTGTANVLLGHGTNTSAVNGTNQIAIGLDVTGTGDNQTVIGNSSQTHVVFGGDALVSGSAASTGSFGSIIAGSDVGGFQQNQFFSPIRMKTDGTANAPAIVINQGGNGIYKYASNEIGISANGAATVVIRQAGLELLSGAYVSGSSTSTGSFGSLVVADKVQGSLRVTSGASGVGTTDRTDGDDLVVENSDHGGISILTPDNKFSNLMFGSPSDNRGAVLDYSHSTKVLNIGTDIAAGKVIFKTAAGTTNMTLDASGNLGINQASPSHKLDVSGTGRFTGTLTTADINTTGLITATGNISGSSTSTGSFGRVEVPTAKNGVNIGAIPSNWTSELNILGTQSTTGIKIQAPSSGNAQIKFYSNNGGSNNDFWYIQATNGGTFDIVNYGPGSFTNMVSIAANTGNMTVRGNVSGSSTSTGSFGELKVKQQRIYEKSDDLIIEGMPGENKGNITFRTDHDGGDARDVAHIDYAGAMVIGVGATIPADNHTGGAGSLTVYNAGTSIIKVANSTTGQDANSGTDLQITTGTDEFKIINREAADIELISNSNKFIMDASENAWSGSATSTGSFGKLSVGNGSITTSGNMILDADGAQIRLQDGGTEFGRISRVSSDLVIKSISNNNDILFKGVDGGGTITALQLDMSEGGNAIFNGNVQVASGGFVFSAGALTLQSGAGTNLVLDAGAGADEITLSTSAFTTTVPIIATGDLDLYAGGGTKVVGLTTSAISLLKNTSISGNLAVDTNVLYVDSSANKVGINRIDPQFDLDVIGDIRATGDVIARRYVISSSVSHITSSFSSGSTIFGDTPGDIHQMTGSLRVTGSGNHYIQTGNIGIGTTSPTFAAGGGIHLKGSNGAFTSLRISVDSNTGVDFSSDSSGHGYMYNRANSDLIFGTNNTARIRVKNDGKVGIGTETPESILHIADGSSGAIGAKLIIDNNASDADGNGTEISFFNAAGASAAGVANSRIRSVASGNTNGYSQLQFWTYHASEAQRMVITSDGKVGIGTASPSKTFHAYANVSSDYAALVENDQATSGHGLQIHSDGNGSGTILFDVDAAGSSRFRVRGDGSVLVGFTTSQAEKLAVNGDFRATGNISGSSTSTGSFGHLIIPGRAIVGHPSVQTIASASSFQINDQGLTTIGLDLRHVTNDVGKGFIIRNLAGNQGGDVVEYGRIKNEIIGRVDGSHSGAYRFSLAHEGTVTERLTILNGGQVGIGVTSPAVLLHLSSSSANQFRIERSGTTNAAVHFKNASDDWYAGITSQQDFSISQNADIASGTEFRIQDSTGYVAIGNASPATHLHINGTHVAARGLLSLESTDHANINLRAASNSVAGLELFNGSNQKWFIGNRGNNSDKFQLMRGSDDAVAVSFDQSLNAEFGGHVSGSSISSASFGRIDVAGKLFVGGSQVGAGGGGSADNLGNHTATQDLDLDSNSIKNVAHITGSGNISGSTTTTASFGSLQLHGKTIHTTAANKVGLGTTNPLGNKLHIYVGESGTDTVTTNSSLVIESNTNNYIQMLNPNGNNSGIIFGEHNDIDIASILHDGGDNSLRFNVAAAERIRIDGSGNVGIGNTTPSSFHNSSLVVGTGATEENLTLYAGATNPSGLFFADSTSGNGRYSGQIYYLHGEDKMQFVAGYTGVSSYVLELQGNKISGSAASTGSFGRVMTNELVDSSFETKFIGTTGGWGVESTKRLYLDSYNDTFIQEASANNIKFSAGGVDILRVTQTKISGSAISTGSFGYLEIADSGGSPTIHLNEPAGGGGDSAVRMTEDGGFRGGFIKYDGSNNELRIGTHANNNRTVSDDINTIKITRNDGYPFFVVDNVYFRQYLIHEGDTDTYLRYQTNQIDLSAGGNVFAVTTTSLSGSATSTGSFGVGHFATNVGIGTDQSNSTDDVLLLSTGGAEELRFTLNNNAAEILSYNRGGSFYDALNFDASTYTFKNSGTNAVQIDSGGTLTVLRANAKVSGSATSTGSFGTLALGSSKIQGSIFVGGTLGVGGSQSTAFHVTNTDPIFRLQNGGNYFDYAHTSGNDLELSYNGGSALVHLTNAGKVGIGTDNPGCELDIQANAGPQLRLKNLNTNNASELILDGNRTSDLDSGAVLFHNIGDNIAKITAYRSGANNSGELRFGTGNAGSVGEHFRIDKVGKVAIGTGEAPNQRLDVTPGARATTFDAADSDTWADVLVRNKNGSVNTATGIGFQNNPNYHTNASSGIAAVKSVDNNDYQTDLAFITRRDGATSTEKMRITHDGKVGIGTTNPGHKLHVVGDIRATGDIIANRLVVSSSVSHITASFSSGSTIFGDTIDDTHQFTGSLTVTSSALTIDSSGTVSGSSTSTGSFGRLETAGVANFGSFTVVPNNTSYAGLDSGGNIRGILKLDSNNKTNIGNPTTSTGIVLSGNNVGIGETSPAELLHINQTGNDFTTIRIDSNHGGTGAGSQIDMNYNGAHFYILNHGTGRTVTRYGQTVAGFAELLAQDSNYGLLIGTGTKNKPIIFGTNSAEVMRIENGKVSGSSTSTGSFGALSIPGQATIGSVVEASSIMYKENVKQIESPLEKITKLRGVEFDYKKTNEHSIGMIAEEVNEIFPELVAKNEDGDVTAMSYTRMTAVLLEAVKELSAEVKELRKLNNYNKSGDKKK